MAGLLNRKGMDLTTGSVIKKLIIFAIPVVLSFMLDKAFNMTDTIMLGIMVGDKAVGAVGATGTIDTLLISIFSGIAGGVSVVVSRCVGAKNVQRARRTVGTSLIICFLGGVVFGLIGFFGAETFLTWMSCSKELLPQAVSYMKIYCLGMPMILLSACATGILRAVGDSVRPMIQLAIGGVVNVILNYFFIAVCGMTVEGVALGTVASRMVAFSLSFIALRNSTGYSRFEFKYLRIYKSELKEVLSVGVPTGIQNALFNISNVLIVSTLNTFGGAATTGYSISAQLTGWMYLAGNAIAVASMSFVSQNYGAKNFRRVKEAILKSVLVAFIVQFSVGMLGFLLARPFFNIMSSDEKVFGFYMTHLSWHAFTYFMCGIMEVLSLAMRSIGKSLTSMIVSLMFACVFRTLWLYTFYLLNPTFSMLLLSYPLSWIMCIMVNVPIIVTTLKKQAKKNEEQQQGMAEEQAESV